MNTESIEDKCLDFEKPLRFYTSCTLETYPWLFSAPLIHSQKMCWFCSPKLILLTQNQFCKTQTNFANTLWISSILIDFVEPLNIHRELATFHNYLVIRQHPLWLTSFFFEDQSRLGAVCNFEKNSQTRSPMHQSHGRCSFSPQLCPQVIIVQRV